MNDLRLLGALTLAVALLGAGPVLAQSSPVAVPIVGSPAAEQGNVPMPPALPQLPPSESPPPSVSVPPAPVTPPNAMPGPLPKRGVRRLELSLTNGTVKLEAENVSLREIFAEWQRQGGCQFVNADKLPATPVALQFPAGTPELVVIDSLLRNLGTATTGYGYIVAPRAARTSGGSSCGAVYILPSSRPTMMAGFGAPIPSAVPGAMAGPEDEIPPVMPFPAGVPPARPVLPGQFVPNQQAQPPPRYPVLPTRSPADPASPPSPSTAPTTPPPAGPGFGPVAPSAPGAGRLNEPPPQTQTTPEAPNGR